MIQRPDPDKFPRQESMRFPWFVLLTMVTVLVILFVAPTQRREPAQAVVPSFCCSAATGQVITASNWNNSFNALYNALNPAVNGLDATNFNATGLGPNFIKTGCPGCTGTFTGNFTMLGTQVTQSAGDANVPLTVNGNSATQSASLLTINQSNGGTNVLAVGPKGQMTTRVAADNVVPFAVNGNSATQSSDIFDAFQSVGGTQLAALSATGDLQIAPKINALNTLTRLAPVYTTTGAAVAATEHAVQFSTPWVISGNCAQQTACVNTSGALITLTNAAVFTSATSFGCVDGIVSQGSSNVAIPVAGSDSVSNDGAHVRVTIINGGTGNISGTVTVWVYCIGT